MIGNVNVAVYPFSSWKQKFGNSDQHGLSVPNVDNSMNGIILPKNGIGWEKND